MTIFKVNKKYHSDLTTDQIQSDISTKLSQDMTLFAKRTYSGKITKDGFKITSFNRFGFPVSISASVARQENGSAVVVEYKSLIFLFILIPFYLMCGFILFAKSPTLNGEPTNSFTIFLYALGGTAILTIFISALTIASIRDERQKLERDLKLK